MSSQAATNLLKNHLIQRASEHDTPGAHVANTA